GDDQRRVEVDPRLPEGALVALQAPGRGQGGVRVVDEADAAVAVLEQLPDRGHGARDLVRDHRGDRWSADSASTSTTGVSRSTAGTSTSRWYIVAYSTPSTWCCI